MSDQVAELIKINCPQCDKLLKAPLKLAGKIIKCPGCENRITLPQVEGAPSEKPAAAVARKTAEDNPYEAPEADEPAASGKDYDLKSLKSGQKLINFAVLVYFLAVALYVLAGPIGTYLGIVALAMGFVGVSQVSSGLRHNVIVTLLLNVLLLLPLVGLIVLLRLNGRASIILREAGYRVGLLGVTSEERIEYL